MQLPKALSQFTEEDVIAVLAQVAKEISPFKTCLSLLDPLIPEVGEDEELDFHQDLLATLYDDLYDMHLAAQTRAEEINDFLTRHSAYGFLGYQLSRKVKPARAFTYGDVDNCLNMNDPVNKELRSHYKSNDEYLAACKESHDEMERERKEWEDRHYTEEICEKLANDAAYRETFYRHIAVPKAFGARGNYKTGEFELCSPDDYEYIYGFDGAALKERRSMSSYCAGITKKPLDTAEDENLAAFASDYKNLKKTETTDRVVEAALRLVPYLYEKSAALESLHRNPARAHSVYLEALKKRVPSKKQVKSVTSNPFANVKALQERTDLSLETVQQSERSVARKENSFNALQPRMTAAFWVLAVLDVLLLIGAFVYTYQAQAMLPSAVYLIGAAICAVAFFLCARYVDCDFSWSERDWKIGILIAIGVVAVIWLGMAVAPEKLLESLHQTQQARM